MLSKQQLEEKKIKIIKCIELFLSGNYTEAEVSKLTGISQSSVDRYLKDKEFICLIYGDLAEQINSEISSRLILNKQNGLSNGGTNAQNTTKYLRDENGRFNGAKCK